MKRKIIYLAITLLFLLIVTVTVIKIATINSSKPKLTKIKVAEVTHSAFYSPLYVAIEKGFFKANGIEVELILTPGADKVSAAVLSNDVEIGFAGAESAIYVYNGGEKDYLQIFSGLTKHDGQFIISRQPETEFTLANLKGKEVLVGRSGGMPAINFENALKKAKISNQEVKLNYAIDFAALGGSFIGGLGDYVNLFEPTASLLVKQGYGYIVANIGQLSDEVPYTTFYARKSFIKTHQDLIERFNQALNQGLEFTAQHEAHEIAQIILPQFTNLALDDLTTIVANYKKTDSWFKDTTIPKQSLTNLEKMIKANNLLKKSVPYEKLIINLNND